MTAKIKLNAASGGGSVSLQGPSNTSNDRVITLPDIADGTLLTTNSSTNRVLQLKSATKTATVVQNSPTYADISGMSVTLTTPQSGSKVLVSIDLQFGGENNSYGGFKLLRDSTAIGLGTEGTGNMSNVTFGAGTGQDNDNYRVRTVSYSILDAHGADGSTNVTYKLQWASVYNTANIYLNRPFTADNNAYNLFGSSTITAIEVTP